MQNPSSKAEPFRCYSVHCTFQCMFIVFLQYDGGVGFNETSCR